MPSLERIDDLGTILSIWAHPDDETYVAGGTMAAATANGQRVVCVSATAGELGTDDPAAWPPERLGRVRRWEARAAMAVLGVDDHRWLDLPDGGLADLAPEGPVGRLADLIDGVSPDTILTFAPEGGTFHPDHQTISRWVTRARERARHRPRVLHEALTVSQVQEWGDHWERWGIFMSDDRPAGVPDEDVAFRIELTGAALDQKVAALTAMHTQVAPAIALLGEADFRASNAVECFVDAGAG
ncbi:MAG: PIG-L family deacetylase [Acidimicrobiales bacterium]|nr:PIG-L family deacetylase [Acidimicrobiales bacterium]